MTHEKAYLLADKVVATDGFPLIHRYLPVDVDLSENGLKFYVTAKVAEIKVLLVAEFLKGGATMFKPLYMGFERIVRDPVDLCKPSRC